ncbi:hypothetical protein ACKKBF_B36470 [Auxenochlorella protothecoides x Auxenochlorella symbiontica]
MVQASLLVDPRLDDVRAAITKARAQLGTLRTLANELLDVLASPGKDRQTSIKQIISRGTESISTLKRLTKTLSPALDASSRAPDGPASASLLDRAWALHSGEELKDEQVEEEVHPAPEYPSRPGKNLSEVLDNLRALAYLGIRADALSVTGSHCEPDQARRVRLSMPGTFVALLGLPTPGGTAPTWATIVGHEEAQGALRRPWAGSRHAVFRAFTQLANGTVLHELRTGSAGVAPAETAIPTALETVVLWLASYSDLFSRPATSTRRLLQRDAASGALLPPLLRPHTLSWHRLGLAAMDPSQRTAEHASQSLAPILPAD